MRRPPPSAHNPGRCSMYSTALSGVQGLLPPAPTGCMPRSYLAEEHVESVAQSDHMDDHFVAKREFIPSP